MFCYWPCAQSSPWPSDALLEAVMRACAAPPDRSGIHRLGLPTCPTLTASCPACVWWCGAPSPGAYGAYPYLHHDWLA